MSLKQSEPLEPIERSLLELQQASEAGVFASTEIDAGRVFGSGSASVPGIFLFLRRTRVWVPLATAAVLSIVVTGAMFRSQINTAHEKAILAGRVGSHADTALVSATPQTGLAHCLSGPNASAPGDCGTLDFDADGDVDLSDIQAYQLAYAAP